MAITRLNVDGKPLAFKEEIVSKYDKTGGPISGSVTIGESMSQENKYPITYIELPENWKEENLFIYIGAGVPLNTGTAVSTLTTSNIYDLCDKLNEIFSNRNWYRPFSYVINKNTFAVTTGVAAPYIDKAFSITVFKLNGTMPNVLINKNIGYDVPSTCYSVGASFNYTYTSSPIIRSKLLTKVIIKNNDVILHEIVPNGTYNNLASFILSEGVTFDIYAFNITPPSTYGGNSYIIYAFRGGSSTNNWTIEETIKDTFTEETTTKTYEFGTYTQGAGSSYGVLTPFDLKLNDGTVITTQSPEIRDINKRVELAVSDKQDALQYYTESTNSVVIGDTDTNATVTLKCGNTQVVLDEAALIKLNQLLNATFAYPENS